MLVESWKLMKVWRSAPLGGEAAPWRALATRSLVPAGPNRPELQLPVLAATRGASLATVEEGSKLVLALPLAGRKSLVTPLSNSGLPHLDAHLGEGALAALLRDVDAPLIFAGVPAAGPFWNALTRASGRLAILDRWERAGLRISGSFEGWFETNFDRKRRKEYKRLRARLAGLESFAACALEAGEDTGPWVQDFLNLEASGWKGERGTALRQVHGMAEALAEAARNLHAQGHLRFWKFSIGGKAVASLFAIVEGGQAWLGKIAYDESFAKYSPGALLILEATGHLFAEGNISLADSCAIPGHPMIDNIWRDRIAIADVIVAAPTVSTMRFAARVRLERLRRRVRSTFRDFYYTLKGRHRS